MYNRLQTASREELAGIIEAYRGGPAELAAQADTVRRRYYGNAVFLRGLVEFSSFCKNDCLYCGLRRSNLALPRKRMPPGEVVACCVEWHQKGFRSFVLQSGEDPWYRGGRLGGLVARLRDALPDSAITLSVGELEPEEYARLREAGADRFLLRHETADPEHYASLHPPGLTLERRAACLRAIRASGLKTGAGFMVGSPGQTTRHLAEDLVFLRELRPHMVGIGPFLPQSQTPFAGIPPGKAGLTLTMVTLTRLMLPWALLPATTALGTLVPDGRMQALRSGANVVMSNITPDEYRESYVLYDGKTKTDNARALAALEREIREAGYTPVYSRGEPIEIGSEKERKYEPERNAAG